MASPRRDDQPWNCRRADTVDAMTSSPDSDASSRDPTGSDQPTPGDPAELEYGPSGYLPAKASARARKIVLRAPLGIQWVIGAVVAGIVVVVAGAMWLGQSGPPTAPYVETVAITDVDDTLVLDDLDALVVTAAGPVVVFADAADLGLCPENGRIEGDAGVWSASTGRGFGVDSLPHHPTIVHDGILYVDPNRTIEGPRPSTTVEPPGC